ncbi:MAG: hypothetical protein ACYDCO_04590 [Armatimonadota bacterium]
MTVTTAAEHRLTLMHRIRRWAELMPVAGWEMRAFMRGARAPVVLFICAVLQVGAGLAVLLTTRNTGLQPEQMAKVGRVLFSVVFLLEAALLVMVPIYSTGLLLREYPRRTMDDLLLTRLTGMEIAGGKLFAAVGYYAVVLVCALPVLALTFIFGGVSPWEVLWSQLLLLMTAACAGAIGIHCAARYRGLVVTVIMTVLLTFGWMLILMPLVVLVTLVSVTVYAASPLVKAQHPAIHLRLLKWLVICLCACVILAIIGLSLYIVVFTYPVVSFYLLMDHSAPGGSEFWFWWLSPLILSGAMLSSARYLIMQAGEMIRPKRNDLR